MARKETLKNRELRVKEKIKDANKLLRETRADGFGKINAVEMALDQHALVTGRSRKKIKQFALGKAKNNFKKLGLLEKQLNKVLKSKWMTRKGRKEIEEKRVATFREKWFVDADVSDDKIVEAIEMLDTQFYHEFMELSGQDSGNTMDVIGELFENGFDSYDVERQMRAYITEINNGTLDMSARDYLLDLLQ